MQKPKESVSTVTSKVIDRPDGQYIVMKIVTHSWELVAAIQEFEKAHPSVELEVVEVTAA